MTRQQPSPTLRTGAATRHRHGYGYDTPKQQDQDPRNDDEAGREAEPGASALLGPMKAILKAVAGLAFLEAPPILFGLVEHASMSLPPAGPL